MEYKIKVLIDMAACGCGNNSYYYKVNGEEFQTRRKDHAKKVCNSLNEKAVNSMYKPYYKIELMKR